MNPPTHFQRQSPAIAAQKNIHVLVGVTGSVAALKLPLLVTELLKIPGLEVQVVTTERAKHFYNPEELPVTLYSDADEWQLWKGRTDPVLHIYLRRWADLMVVAPLDANTLAKIANGICDNLLTCVVRAWDLSRPLLFCPAMNTAMWEHPITARQIEQLKSFGYTEIPCIAKKLVCRDEGLGAMAEVTTIVGKVKAILSEWGSPAHSWNEWHFLIFLDGCWTAQMMWTELNPVIPNCSDWSRIGGGRGALPEPKIYILWGVLLESAMLSPSQRGELWLLMSLTQREKRLMQRCAGLGWGGVYSFELCPSSGTADAHTHTHTHTHTPAAVFLHGFQDCSSPACHISFGGCLHCPTG